MVVKVFAAALLGLECKLIDVEVDFRHGLSHFVIVGLGDKSVQESKERIVSAIRNSASEFIPKRLIVNLAPADMPKSGPIFDLAIAAGYLLATAQVAFDPTNTVFLGELALDGSVRPVRGVLPIVDGLKQLGVTKVFLPAANAAEAALIKGLSLYPLDTLDDLIRHFQGKSIPEYRANPAALLAPAYNIPDLTDVRGLLHAKRALEIVAAGGHNMLLFGSPGAGKTYLARCLQGILPDMSIEEKIEVTKIYSVSGQLSESEYLVNRRPFRSPHHTSSRVSIIGGGTIPQPGEISLAHRGVLFLDELPEFSTATIESLRQPMEDKSVNISRVSGRICYPANFMLIAAMNPCRCGNWGDKSSVCTCSLIERRRYIRKVSNPILDRIDMKLRIDKLSTIDVFTPQLSEPSAVVKQRVECARLIQIKRLKSDGLFCNAEMGEPQLRVYCKLNAESVAIAKQAMKQFKLSPRAYARLLKVSRTIADLEAETKIKPRHLAEALSYRMTLPGAD